MFGDAAAPHLIEVKCAPLPRCSSANKGEIGATAHNAGAAPPPARRTPPVRSPRAPKTCANAKPWQVATAGFLTWEFFPAHISPIELNPKRARDEETRSVTRFDDKLVVTYADGVPPPGTICTWTITYPSHIVSAPKSDLPVVFVPTQ